MSCAKRGWSISWWRFRGFLDCFLGGGGDSFLGGLVSSAPLPPSELPCGSESLDAGSSVSNSH